MCGKKNTVSAYLVVGLVIAGVMSMGIVRPVGAEPSYKAIRTILLYGCGSDLEDDEEGFLSRNLRQILNARIRPDTNIIVMTGGSNT